MKHRSSKLLFEHWEDRRGTKPAPERSAIDPAVLRAGLADIFVLSFNRPRGHPFRLAGTRVCAAAGRELKEQPFAALWSPRQQDEILHLVDLIAGESIGIVAGVTGQTVDKQSIELELLLLPLQHWGRPQSRLIGAIAPLSVPYWFGAEPIGPLVLGDYRYLGMRALPPVATLRIPRSDTRVRHGFVVYDGGQS